MKEELIMSALHQDLARAMHQANLDDAARLRRVLILRRSRRAQRSAAAASQRARRAMSLAASL